MPRLMALPRMPKRPGEYPIVELMDAWSLVQLQEWKARHNRVDRVRTTPGAPNPRKVWSK